MNKLALRYRTNLRFRIILRLRMNLDPKLRTYATMFVWTF